MADFRLPLRHAFFHVNEHTVPDVLIYMVPVPLFNAIILMTLFRRISEFLTCGIRQSTSQPEPAFIIASGNEAETFESDFEPLPVQEEYVVEIQGEQYGEAFG